MNNFVLKIVLTPIVITGHPVAPGVFMWSKGLQTRSSDTSKQLATIVKETSVAGDEANAE